MNSIRYFHDKNANLTIGTYLQFQDAKPVLNKINMYECVMEFNGVKKHGLIKPKAFVEDIPNTPNGIKIPLAAFAQGGVTDFTSVSVIDPESGEYSGGLIMGDKGTPIDIYAITPDGTKVKVFSEIIDF